MLRIGICDDSAEARQHMLQLCQKYYENNTDAFEYKMYKNAEEVLEYCDDEENKKIDIRLAMDIYYRSLLCKQIHNGENGIQYLDYKYLAEDLIENEKELFKSN